MSEAARLTEQPAPGWRLKLGIGLFVLGGDFWDQVRALFVYSDRICSANRLRIAAGEQPHDRRDVSQPMIEPFLNQHLGARSILLFQPPRAFLARYLTPVG
jgi:hypothetical protein